MYNWCGNAFEPVIVGPSHMRTFATDEVLREKFVNAALSRSIMPAALDSS